MNKTHSHMTIDTDEKTEAGTRHTTMEAENEVTGVIAGNGTDVD